MTIAQEELDHVLHVLASWPAVLPMTAVPDALQMPLEAASAITRELLALGLASIWPSPLGPALTLTEAAARRVGIELHSPNRLEKRFRLDTQRGIRRIVWCETGKVPREKPPPPWPDGHRPEVLATDIWPDALPAERPGLDGFSDPRTPPAEAYHTDPDFRFRHVRLLGFNHPGWSPALEAADPCRICRGKRLGPTECCLACLRVFAEWELGTVRPEEQPRRQYEPSPSGLGGGKGAPGRARKAAKQHPGQQVDAAWKRELDAMRRELRRKP
jgi:hypothetical protein